MSGERPGFEQVFNETYDPVSRYAARRVPADAVQDVVSETFLIAWRRFGELRGEPLPWLLGIARRVAATQRRGSGRREALRRRLAAEPPAAEPARLPPSHDAALDRALALLGERDREALLLTVWDGLSHEAAAGAMGCSTGALAVRLHRARRRLARLLESGAPYAEERAALIEEAGSQ